jgi:hypothetical protein
MSEGPRPTFFLMWRDLHNLLLMHSEADFFLVQDLPNYEFFLQSSGIFCSVSLVLYPLSSVAVIGSGAKPLHLMCRFCQKQKIVLSECWVHAGDMDL